MPLDTQPRNLAESPRFMPLLLLMFFGSGCAALIYEIIWFQLLQLVIGSTAVSLAVVLGTFMGGMCLGSLALARIVAARQHPLRVYALLELGIGLLGIMVLVIMPSLARVYMAGAEQGLAGILLRGAVCAVCLMPPTLLMGATLPAIARWTERLPNGVSWLGFFNGANIAGAVFGCLLAGFYLLRIHDTATATLVAATVNGTVAGVGLVFAALSPHHAPTGGPTVDRVVNGRDSRCVYITIALSGLCALGAEVIWTRLLSLMLGPTVYTFSIILAVFLVGLGIGNSIGSFLIRGSVQPWQALGCCQILLAAAIAWTGHMLASSLPYWPINPSLARSPWFNFQLDLARCCWAILPPTILWGASFPLALAAVASHGRDSGRVVGSIYAANTVGAILGAIGTSLILIAWMGTRHAQQLLIGLSTLAALLMLAPYRGLFRSNTSMHGEPQKPGLRIAGASSLLVAMGCAAWLAWTVPGIPWGLVAYGRHFSTKASQGDLLFLGEGMNASVAVTQLSSGVRNFHVSGKVEASSEPQDMRLQRMLGHLPALMHPKPRSVLVVGCGAGVTAGSFVVHPDIEKIVICEIEPLIPRVVAPFFRKENHDVVANPRVKVVYDDARHYILTTSEKFDIITSDPIHPWVRGAATLYTKEYFELVKRHLNPGGLITQWVPLYESNPGVVKSELATFFDVFPNGTIWSNDQDGEGYDIVLLGHANGLEIDVDELHERMHRDHRVAESLEEVGFRTVVSLLGTYAGQGSELGPWLNGAEINRDRSLRLQYLAGMGLDVDQAGFIYDELLSYRRFPDKLFVGSDQRKQMLRLVIERANANK
jgi:spermidine synthase